MSRITELHDVGQSIWLDYIERSMLQSGEMKKLVDDGLRGVTSNPTIFQQAIAKSDAYQNDLARLANNRTDAKSIFEALAISDIRTAADILRSIYDTSNQQDGFVSLEVAPDLAYDTEATIAEARRLFSAIERPNVMIKVPATEAGLPAIRQLIADGININVTLIFALQRYAAVKEAYLSGLEERLSQDQPIRHIASVASFFVSRVDSNVDSRLDELAESNDDGADRIEELKGRTAVANAKLAYRQFQTVFSGPRWQVLAEAGAQMQRPLWASTSTKNPAYSDLLYVENLMGPHTVNTMPPATLDAFRDHARVRRTIDTGVAEAEADLSALAALGISLDEVTDELEKEGVRKFADSFDELLDTIESRRKEYAMN